MNVYDGDGMRIEVGNGEHKMNDHIAEPLRGIVNSIAPRQDNPVQTFYVIKRDGTGQYLTIDFCWLSEMTHRSFWTKKDAESIVSELLPDRVTARIVKIELREVEG